MTVEDVANYVLEDKDERTAEDWAAMSLADLRAEWERGPRFERPPYPVDRNRYARLTRVRSEIIGRSAAKPPDGVTWGKGVARGKAS